nr:uncharacterized protein LOC115266620 [Aedes albopictus]XP_029728983.1 uncharacterized protein LOC115266620 [Aedes albopictus]
MWVKALDMVQDRLVVQGGDLSGGDRQWTDTAFRFPVLVAESSAKRWRKQTVAGRKRYALCTHSVEQVLQSERDGAGQGSAKVQISTSDEIWALVKSQMLTRKAFAAEVAFSFSENTRIIANSGASANKSILRVWRIPRCRPGVHLVNDGSSPGKSCLSIQARPGGGLCQGRRQGDT